MESDPTVSGWLATR